MVVGLENTNLRSKMTRRLRRCGVSGAPRLLHSVTRQERRASRQTELQSEFTRCMVFMGFATRLAFPSRGYLLINEDDFARAAGVMVAV